MTFEMNLKSTFYSLYDLDAIDQRIIEFLQENGRESFARIAEAIGIPSSTVRDRTKRMIESGVLQIVALVTPPEGGKEVVASVGVKLNGGTYQRAADEILKMEEVSRLVICSGSFDLFVELSCQDNAHLLEAISQLKNMPQVQYTESFVYLSVAKEPLRGSFARK